jgi:hypothetical protein
MRAEQLLFKILFNFKKLLPFALGISPPGELPGSLVPHVLTIKHCTGSRTRQGECPRF